MKRFLLTTVLLAAAFAGWTSAFTRQAMPQDAPEPGASDKKNDGELGALPERVRAAVTDVVAATRAVGAAWDAYEKSFTDFMKSPETAKLEVKELLMALDAIDQKAQSSAASFQAADAEIRRMLPEYHEKAQAARQAGRIQFAKLYERAVQQMTGDLANLKGAQAVISQASEEVGRFRAMLLDAQGAVVDLLRAHAVHLVVEAARAVADSYKALVGKLTGFAEKLTGAIGG